MFLAFFFEEYYEKNSKPYDEDHVYEIRVLPYDLDMNFHLNNAQYFSFMEHARFDMILQHGNVFNRCRKAGFGWVVAGVSFQFRRSAKLFEKVKIVTRVACADEKWLYVEQNLYVKDKFIGRGIVRMCTVDKKGAVPTKRYFEEILGVDWNSADAKYRMTREDYRKYMTALNDSMDGNTSSDKKDSLVDDVMPRVSSFVFHDETLKEKQN
ncbi:hypothetical protein C9374_009650 [Naegleria lovaniensis]|uniref:Thioesterase n=1 Tax=Naegleria lovaniensis TaxID=51637 RepID=A0AA88H1V7_NAELO|nr:uncharacterized protein C9374_009650 [Naegleria lovaniensis]KAG2393073.1 hypothetical protein C9374_009650 [Naegleria lovaniensis]